MGLLIRTLVALTATVFVAALVAGAGGAGVGATIEQTDYAALYSPDGTKIAFRRIPTGFYGGPPTPELWVMDVNGPEQHRVTVLSQQGAYEENAAWTPDGRALVFQQRGDLASVNNGGAIGIADVDGSNVRSLGAGFLDNSSAPVSGDGWITDVAASTTDWFKGASAIELMRLDGSERHVVLGSDDPRFPAGDDNRFWNATFATDGKIGFVFRGAIYTVNRDGSNLTFVAGARPTTLPGYGAVGPSFSPDGRFLGYVSAAVTGVQENALYINSDAMEYLAFGGALPGFSRLSWSPTDDAVVVGDRTRYAVVYASDDPNVARNGGPDNWPQWAVRVGSDGGRYSSWSPNGKTIAFNGALLGCRTGGIAVVTLTAKQPRFLTGDCRIFGSAHADIIHGREISNIIFGRGGNDRLFGGPGHDSLYGGAGNDYLDSGPGGGLLDGGAGNDVLVGHGGDDVIVGGSGHDRIDAGGGADRVDARDGERDIVDCGPGQDRAVVDRIDVVRNCETVRKWK